MEVVFEFIEAKDFAIFFKKNRSKIFNADFDFDIEKVLSEKEKENRIAHWQRLKDIHRYYLIAKLGNEIVGWSFGMQKSGEDFYMINSAVFPEYRQKGIYTSMMKKAVEWVSNLGFQRIYSKHKMSNNAVLIPKLKFGFKITGFEINDVFGNLVELSYYTNLTRQELLEVRIGTRKIDDEKMGLIK